MKNLFLSYLFMLAFHCSAQQWTAINAPTETHVLSCFFINENTGWVITAYRHVFKTTDGGTTWSELEMPPFPQNMLRSYNGIIFIDENTGMIPCTNIITDYNNYDPSLISTILWTDDGGETWEYKNQGNSNSHLSSAAFVDPSTAYVIGQYGKSFKTNDGGETWQALTFSSVGYSGQKLFAVNANTIYFAGLQNFDLIGAFGKLVNDNWNVSNISANPSMYSLFFTDAQKGWTCSDNGEILRTVNGGTSWAPCTTNVTSAIADISFKDDQNGWAATWDGKIIRTEDGQNWHIEYDGTVRLRAIAVHGLNATGYAVGDNGLILKYDPTMSVSATDKQPELMLYPNPSNSKVTIKFPDSTGINTVASIRNSLGQTVMETTSSENTITFQTDDLEAGIYFISMTQRGIKFSEKKLIIAHGQY